MNVVSFLSRSRCLSYRVALSVILIEKGTYLNLHCLKFIDTSHWYTATSTGHALWLTAPRREWHGHAYTAVATWPSRRFEQILKVRHRADAVVLPLIDDLSIANGHEPSELREEVGIGRLQSSHCEEIPSIVCNPALRAPVGAGPMSRPRAH